METENLLIYQTTKFKAQFWRIVFLKFEVIHYLIITKQFVLESLFMISISPIIIPLGLSTFPFIVSIPEAPIAGVGSWLEVSLNKL